ncbi:MAG: hypothetical protein MUC87_16695 [Bacteroidia bacterium]|jgi:vacuolar-type H+-ATPase subunit E/Vma4|nr:hypothetical protein [Bacteroidia bacterium]
MSQALLKAKIIAAVEATSNSHILEAIDDLLKKFTHSSEDSIDLVQYNKEIDKALDAVAKGEFTDNETVRKRFLKE